MPAAGEDLDPGSAVLDAELATIAELASHYCGVPYAWISLDGEIRCSVGPPGEAFVFRADVPFTTRDGQAGVLVVADDVAHTLPMDRVRGLEALAHQAAAQTNLSALLSEPNMHPADRDPLTGLAGRAFLRDRLAVALGQSDGVAVAFLDFDDFKRVNEVLGHDAGDRILRAAANRLAGVIRPADTVARFGGDKFVVACSGITREEDALRIAERLSGALKDPFHSGGTPITLTATVGIAFGDGLTKSPEELLRDADTALHRAKQRFAGAATVFDETQRRGAVARLQVENALRAALENDELTLAYQPIVGLREANVMGFEALLRWEHEALGPISPLEFIPVAEDNGLIVPVGHWVLERACTDIADLSAMHPGKSFYVSVNLSPRQVVDPELPELIERVLTLTGLEPSRLHLELTEGTLLEHNTEVREALVALRGLGLRILIDDFGTGYSALSYLTRLPVDGVKIDRSFVQELDSETPGSAIVEAVNALARSLGLLVIAEGVETESQAARLRSLGVPLAQGYYFGRPTPANFVELLL